ncbi:MCP four helix bundle domain-containing protein, partial [Acetobacteraceae bacterium KSS8]|nr:MCP four helix bundle domain-containing protein [Acetobacteraceae bacterium KSS8]
MFQRLSIRHQLVACFAGLLTILVGLGVLSSYGLHKVLSNARTIETVSLPQVRLAATLRGDMEDYDRSVVYLILFSKPEDMASEEGWLNKKYDAASQTMAALSPTLDTERKVAKFQDFQRHWQDYTESAQKVVALAKQGDKVGAFAEDRRATTDMLLLAATDIKQLIDMSNEDAAAAVARSEQAGSSTLTIMFLAIGLTILAFVAVAVVLIRSIGRNVTLISDAMMALSRNELDTTIPLVGDRTEMGRIAGVVEIFKAGMIEAERMRAAQEAERAAKEKRAQALEQLVNGFEAQIASMVGMLASASTE